MVKAMKEAIRISHHPVLSSRAKRRSLILSLVGGAFVSITL
jgi:hypothetical protein